MNHIRSYALLPVKGLNCCHLLAFQVLLVILCIAPPSLAETDESAPTILILGDSLSAGYGIPIESGWVSLLEQKLSTQIPGATIINASISGETTGGGRQRLPGLLERHDPDITVIELGGNDGLRGFPLRVVRDNLEALVSMARESGSQPLLVGMRIPPNYGPDYTEGFFNLFQEVARDQQVPLVPFFLEKVALNKELMQQDGIHPTAEAQPLLLGTISEKLMPLLN